MKKIIVITLLMLFMFGCAIGKNKDTGLFEFRLFGNEVKEATQAIKDTSQVLSGLYDQYNQAVQEYNAAQSDEERAKIQQRMDGINTLINQFKPEPEPESEPEPEPEPEATLGT